MTSHTKLEVTGISRNGAERHAMARNGADGRATVAASDGVRVRQRLGLEEQRLAAREGCLQVGANCRRLEVCPS